MQKLFSTLPLKAVFAFGILALSSLFLSLTPSVSPLTNATFLSFRHCFRSFDNQGLSLGNTLTCLVLITDSSQNCIYELIQSVSSWGSLHESKNTSQSVVSKQHRNLSSLSLFQTWIVFMVGVSLFTHCLCFESKWMTLWSDLPIGGLHIVLYASSILP